MANMIPITAEQYRQAVALRDAGDAVADLFDKLAAAKVQGIGVRTVFNRQHKQLADIPTTPPDPPALAGQKLKQLRKYRGNIIVACDVLDGLKLQGIPLCWADIWTPLRALNTALNGIPDENNRPYVAGQKHDL